MAEDQKLKKYMRPGDVISLFNQLAAKKELAFEYVVEGCYARAHFMCEDIEETGVKAYKAWIEAEGRDINVSFKGEYKARVGWKYHVAPTVKVKDGKGVQDIVLDPSMFDGPVTKDEWASAMEGESSELVKVSRFQKPSPNGEPNGYLSKPRKLSVETYQEHAKLAVEHCRKQAEKMYVTFPLFESKWLRNVKIAIEKKCNQTVKQQPKFKKPHAE